MKQFEQIEAFREYRRALPALSVGFVPTMGALHQGHGELIKRSVSDNALTVLSVYVNQTQFNNPQDLTHYPRQLEQDLELANELGVDAVLLPSYEAMYPDDFMFQIDEKQFSRTLCGAHRPGHFIGVMTVVMKLLNIVKPDSAYFGEKDYQQLTLIRRMAEAFFLDTKIVGVPTVRESDGLAMSSRNLNLTKAQRVIAKKLNQTLQSSLTDELAIKELSDSGFEVDYLQTIGERRLAAASLGSVRLIDNVEVTK